MRRRRLPTTEDLSEENDKGARHGFAPTPPDYENNAVVPDGMDLEAQAREARRVYIAMRRLRRIVAA
jgi:hypothetical protein